MWYCGEEVGLDFNFSPAEVLTNGKSFSLEGVAFISDSHGNLLSYTDGSTLWNRNHLFLADGGKLFFQSNNYNNQ